MKLINRTRSSDSVVQQVLKAAAASLGKRLNTTDVVVKVTQGRFINSTGIAERADLIWKQGSGYIKTKGGTFTIVLPKLSTHPAYQKYDALWCAEQFFKTARHEWCHIYDFQYEKRHHTRLDHSQRVNGRRPAHDYRPEEKRVQEYVQQAEQRKTANDYVDSIVNLALEIERLK